MILRYLGMAVALANISIIIILLSIYWKNYRKWKSEYTLGLLIFGTFLLIQNLLSMGFLAPPPPMPSGGEHGNEYSLLLINISQLVALSALLKISWK
ncbi:hypothetical protein [uncultured Methanobacterium sp.]|uniref:hypothetical protein n=1 Tax=uncultured Methanobacterium sp. TaxID=176306 RepID=UPI002AA90699|nr:hypothetical protein [uncultured Methanobacterium sp.]